MPLAEIESVDVFRAGDSSEYRSYRLPSIAVSAGGTVLVACEGYLTSGGDWAGGHILLRRSMDGGRTWLPPQTVATFAEGQLAKNPMATARNLGVPGAITFDNAVLIGDRNGAVHLLYCVEYMRCFHMRSDDEGATFTPAVEITPAFDAFRSEYPWRVLAAGPGHGIQLRNGRLLVPVWLSPGTGNNAHHPSVSATIYSDDHGQTWQAGEIAIPDTAEWVNPNEGTMVELADGRVLLNVRTISGKHRRLQTTSPDGVSAWSRPEYHEELYEPVCAAALIRLSGAGDGRENRLLFVNPCTPGVEDGSQRRRNLTVKLSYDEGRSWAVSRTLEPGYGGYSDLAVRADGTILCVYEGGDPARLAVSRFTLEWLTGGKDSFEKTPVCFHSVLDACPTPGCLSPPEGIEHVMVEPSTTDQYHFLHDAVIVVHREMFMAGWYNCPEREIEDESLIRARRSHDGGKTWSSLEVVASDRAGEGVFYVPVQFLSHHGTLHAYVGKMKGGHDRIVSCAVYELDEDNGTWLPRGEIADLFLPNTTPFRMVSGDFIMAGRMASRLGQKPLIPAVAISSGEALTGRWRVIPLGSQELPAGHCPETALLEQNGELLALVRNGGSSTPLVYRSWDNGETWREIRQHGFRAAPVKMYAGTLTTGQHYVLFNYPLRDGESFSRRFLVLGVSRPNEMYPVAFWRIQGAEHGDPSMAHYPCAVEHRGRIFIVYTAHYANLRACELAIVPISSLETERFSTQNPCVSY